MDSATAIILEGMTRVVVLTEYGRHAEYLTFAVPRIGETVTLRNFPPKRHLDPGDTEYATLKVTAIDWERNRDDRRGAPRMSATVRVERT